MTVSSSKPISSPGRVEKFPPPLVRFLRSNVRSRSTGKLSRASPLYTRRKTTAAAASTGVETTQEPSSPKVTCIGQVRVRRSEKPPGGKREKPTGKNHCYHVRKPNFCNSINVMLRPRSNRPVWRAWIFPFGCISGKNRANSSRKESNRAEEVEDEEEEIEVKRRRKFASPSATPPKNALLLTRCSSAPYRSSSLAGRFWDLSLKTEEAEKTEKENGENRAIPTSETEAIGRDSTAESRICGENEGDFGCCEGIIENKETGVKTGELVGIVVASPPLAMLKRCNSEPARGSMNSFWRQRRLEFTESSIKYVD
ncbi:hypothetical protein Ancab_014669 [Ancistrocladus abbreviatus]